MPAISMFLRSRSTAIKRRRFGKEPTIEVSWEARLKVANLSRRYGLATRLVTNRPRQRLGKNRSLSRSLRTDAVHPKRIRKRLQGNATAYGEVRAGSGGDCCGRSVGVPRLLADRSKHQFPTSLKSRPQRRCKIDALTALGTKSQFTHKV